MVKCIVMEYPEMQMLDVYYHYHSGTVKITEYHRGKVVKTIILQYHQAQTIFELIKKGGK